MHFLGYAPNGKKTIEDIDEEPLLSPGRSVDGIHKRRHRLSLVSCVSCFYLLSFLPLNSWVAKSMPVTASHVQPAGHEEIPAKVVNKRSGESRLKEMDIFRAITHHGLDNLLLFQCFAHRQLSANDDRWVRLVMRSGNKKVLEWISSATSMCTAAAQLTRKSMTHMDMLQEGLKTECLCGGRAIDGWVPWFYLYGIFSFGRSFNFA